MNKKYKETFSAIRPSDESVERIMNMTKANHNKRRLAPALAMVACLAILVTGIFAGGSIFKNANIADIPQSPTPNTIQQSDSNSKIGPGFVMVAYANESKDVKIVDDINSLEPSTPFICQIGTVDIKGKSQSEIDSIVDDIYKKYRQFESTNEYGDVIYFLSTNTDIYDDAVIYEAYCGNFNFDIIDDTVENVKQIRASNENKKYGYVEIQANDVYYNDDLTLKNDGIDYTKSVFLTNSYDDHVVLSGDRYKKCYALGKEIGGVSKYFGINWKIGDELLNELNSNPNFDLTQIKDTLTFEVEFNDGSIAKSVISIAFTSDGKMYAVGGDYEFID